MNPIRLYIPHLPDARNINSRGASKQAAAAHNRVTQDAKDEMRLYMRMAGYGEEMIERAYVRYTFYMPDLRGRDVDNLIGSAKPWLDGLCAYSERGGSFVINVPGLLVGDDWKHLPTLTARCIYRKGEPGTEIEIWETPDA